MAECMWTPDHQTYVVLLTQLNRMTLYAVQFALSVTKGPGHVPA